ncbi:MAG: DnaB-like helicase N-terminal domain-containing protein, partial [Fidelibacterota bacterium]
MNETGEALNPQPQAVEAEQAVLGSMLASKDAASKVFGLLKTEHFYRDTHARIYAAMTELYGESISIDTISVIDQLKKKKELERVGGAYYITGLVESVPTVANVENYARIVLEKALLRQLIAISHDIS